MRLLFALLASAGFMSQAHAGYAQVTPPANWTTSAGATMYKAAANDISFANGVRGSAGVVNVAGRAVTMPAAYRFAANAAPTAARYAFGHPALFVGVLATSAAYAYFKDQGLTLEAGSWVYTRENKGKLWSGDFNTPAYGQSTSASEACNTAASVNLGGGSTGSLGSPNPPNDPMSYTCAMSNPNVGYFSMVITARKIDNTVKRPANEEDFVTAVGTNMPDGLPQMLPIPLPVEVPILNPTPEPNPRPAILPTPTPQPMRVPAGEPQPVPNTNPQQWRTEVIDITPSPTPNEPWRVDLVPKEIFKTDNTKLPEISVPPVVPQPLVEPDTNPDGSPNPNAGQPIPNAPAEKPTEFKTCGLPGTPACKIDETGTPPEVEETRYDSKLEPYKQKRDADLQTMGGTQDKPFFQGWNTFFSAPPVVECVPITLPEFGGQSMGAINPCGTVNGVRYVMAYIWALGGFWLCLGMVKRAV